MEDFIERVGQSYLERKAFAAPQQLENIAKKQLTGGSEKEAKAKDSRGKKATEEEEEGEEEAASIPKKKGNAKTLGQTSSGSSEKDKEIARLKRQLAQSKLEKPKASSGKSASGPKALGISRTSNGQKAFTSKAAKGNKETKELAALGALGAVGGGHQERKNKNSKKETSGSKLAKAANIVEISPTKRRMSTSQQNEHDGGAKSEHGGGSKSEHGGGSKSEHGSGSKSEHGGGSKSEHGGNAKSMTSHLAITSQGNRRPSNASQSQHGSMAKSVAPASVQPALPSHAKRSEEEREIVESQRSRRQSEQERDLYVVEVEEEVPRSRRKDAGGVVEVETSSGRTVYRV